MLNTSIDLKKFHLYCKNAKEDISTTFIDHLPSITRDINIRIIKLSSDRVKKIIQRCPNLKALELINTTLDLSVLLSRMKAQPPLSF